jgi:hypothetical protein
LNLKLLIPNSKKNSAEILFNYLKWLREERKVSSSYEENIIKGVLKLSKFMYHHESNSDTKGGDQPYLDLEIVNEIKKLFRNAHKRSKNEVHRNSLFEEKYFFNLIKGKSI